MNFYVFFFSFYFYINYQVDVKKATPPKDQNQQNALMQPQWNQMQNWNMGNPNYFPADPNAQGKKKANFKFKFSPILILI